MREAQHQPWAEVLGPELEHMLQTRWCHTQHMTSTLDMQMPFPFMATVAVIKWLAGGCSVR